MKSGFLIFIISISLMSFSIAQNTYGLGIAFFPIDTSQAIRFYQSSSDEVPTKVLRFCNQQTKVREVNLNYILEEITFCADDTIGSWLHPEECYLMMTMRCLEETKSAYLVCVNSQTTKSLWIKKAENKVELQSWKDCFLQAYQVSRKEPAENRIKLKPNDKSPTVDYNDMDCFRVLDVKGSWLKIETAFHCEGGYIAYRGETVTGWIKWNDGQKILVDYVMIGE